jgi:hypothetical protein
MQIGPGELLQRLPGSGKQEVIHTRRIMQEQAVEFIGNGEYNMKIGHRKQIPLSIFNPGFTLGILAFGAMTVTTTVV